MTVSILFDFDTTKSNMHSQNSKVIAKIQSSKPWQQRSLSCFKRSIILRNKCSSPQVVKFRLNNIMLVPFLKYVLFLGLKLKNSMGQFYFGTIYSEVLDALVHFANGSTGLIQCCLLTCIYHTQQGQQNTLVRVSQSQRFVSIWHIGHRMESQNGKKYIYKREIRKPRKPNKQINEVAMGPGWKSHFKEHNEKNWR